VWKTVLLTGKRFDQRSSDAFPEAFVKSCLSLFFVTLIWLSHEARDSVIYTETELLKSVSSNINGRDLGVTNLTSSL
jgi:hypothetical protein